MYIYTPAVLRPKARIPERLAGFGRPGGRPEGQRGVQTLAPSNTPTPSPDHFETNDQKTCNEGICASVTFVSTFSLFLWYWG